MMPELSLYIAISRFMKSWQFCLKIKSNLMSERVLYFPQNLINISSRDYRENEILYLLSK